MPSGNISVDDSTGTGSDESFQHLLLRLSSAAAQGGDANELIGLFCRETRDFFQVSGTYFWEIVSAEEMVGTEAAGVLVERFKGSRLSLQASHCSIALEAVRSRKTIFRNDLDTRLYPMAAEYHTRSIMGAPLTVAGEVIGVAVFLHDSDPA